MLQNALDLSEKRVRECMVPRTEIVAIDFNTSLESVKSKFISTKLSKLLVKIFIRETLLVLNELVYLEIKKKYTNRHKKLRLSDLKIEGSK